MAEEITILAPAKINLFLDVLDKRPDGYHNISSIMQTIGIYDRITVKMGDALTGECKVTVTSDGGAPSGEENIAYKAARAFFGEMGIGEYAVDISISKRIPVEAGLGGGSSDAASVICALNMLCGSPADTEMMMRIGALVGADVPFCIKRGTCVVGGIGDVVTSCTPMPDCAIVVAVPKEERVSTKEAYSKIDRVKKTKPVEEMISALAECTLEAVGGAMFNKFEYILKKTSRVPAIKEKFLSLGADAAMMSGSGSAVFALFYDVSSAKAAMQSFDDGTELFLCRPDRRSFGLVEND